MTRQPHDQFAKQYLKELLSPFGKVEIGREVTGEVRQVDIYFFPISKPPNSDLNLGVFGKILLSDFGIKQAGMKLMERGFPKKNYQDLFMALTSR